MFFMVEWVIMGAYTYSWSIAGSDPYKTMLTLSYRGTLTNRVSFRFLLFLTLLLQHLFRFSGHPEAYIPILPASGLISEILSAMNQCIIYGRDSMLIALFIIGSLGRIA